MTGKEILDMCAKIIKRQDLDRDLLLMFINQQRKVALRSNYLYKLDKWVKDLEPISGFILMDNIKQVRYLEYCLDEQKKKLIRLNTLAEAFEMYDSIDDAGEPSHYIILNGGIKVFPMPTDGTINVFGEFYPVDLTDSAIEDTLSKELSDALIYLGVAEYLDMLDETDKAKFWREKGTVMLQTYLIEIKRQMTDDTEMLARDPFGNLGLVHGSKQQVSTVNTITNIDGGVI